MKYFHFKVYSKEHGLEIINKLTKEGWKDVLKFGGESTTSLFPKYIRTDDEDRKFNWGPWAGRDVNVPYASVLLSFDDLFNPRIIADFLVPKIEVSVKVNGQKVSPSTISLETGFLKNLGKNCGDHAKINATLDDLYNEGFVKDLMEKPEIKLTLEINGEKVSPASVSQETWNNLRNINL